MNDHNIKSLARYVDDIIVIFDSTDINEARALDFLNIIHNKINSHLKKQTPPRNYLDLTIVNNEQILKIQIGI